MRVRPWTDDDRQVFDEWVAARGENPETVIVSPFGGMVIDDQEEPLMAGFVFLAVGVGVCWIERFVSRPGSGMKLIRDAGALLLDYLRLLALENDYGVAYSNFARGSMATEAEKLGFVRVGDCVVSMVMVLRDESS